jgi:predicted AAA+ superfamily ATPase
MQRTILPRHLEGPVRAALADTPVVLILGPRQSGRSTLCERVAAGPHGARYLTFDDAAVLAAARTDPGGFITGLEGRVVLDEIQHVPELFPAIKRSVDRNREPGRFLLTGSTNVLLLPRLAESLAGRMEVLTLWPLSQGEIAGARERFLDVVFGSRLPALAAPAEARDAVVARALSGGYPEVLSREPGRRGAWFGSYVTTILQRDVRDLSNVESLAQLPRLLSLVAARSASLANLAELSRSAAIAQTTLRRYMTLLELTFLVRTLPAWSSNLGKRLTRAPRLLMGDTGLLGHLAGLDGDRVREHPALAGPLLENFVAMELAKQAAWSDVRVSLHHYRTVAGQEVDLVAEAADGRVVGIEVKAAASVGASDLRGLESLREACGKRFHRGVVLYNGSESVPFGPGLTALPISALWTLGAR